jgi:D-proline reductase (dithiol) PrdB
MKPIDYVSGLNDMYQSQGFPPYKWSVFDSSPFTSLKTPIKKASVALISSAGISMDDQEPFDPWAVNGLSFREIPTNTPFNRLNLNHNYFDHRDAVKDFNCIFPIERLKELEKEEEIGRLAPVAFSLGMGRLYKRTALQNETVPKIVDVLRDQNADAVLLVAA